MCLSVCIYVYIHIHTFSCIHTNITLYLLFLKKEHLLFFVYLKIDLFIQIDCLRNGANEPMKNTSNVLGWGPEPQEHKSQNITIS